VLDGGPGATASARASLPLVTRPGAATATGNGAAASAGPMNVLFLTVDSLRADMPWAGYPRPIAPNLTAFADTNAYSISSFTSKSTAGFLTGRFPSELLRTGGFFTHDKEGGEKALQSGRAEAAKLT
jgi:choline-sulfatase